MHLDKRGLVLSTIGKPIQYKGNLLQRLGGKDDLFAIITTFCIQLQNHSRLAKFYGTYKLEDLRLLMIDFFNAALLLIFPIGFDLKQHIVITQYHQISTGMGPQEFDLLVQAFRDAFSSEPISEEIVEEVIGYINTLRIYFEDEKIIQRAKKIAASMEAEEETEVEININSGHHHNNNDATSKIRSWSRGSKGRRRRNLSPAQHSESPKSNDGPRRMPRRGSLQYRIKSVMPIRRISVPKEHDKDPGLMTPNKKSLDKRHSSLSSSQDSTDAENVRLRSESKDSRVSKRSSQGSTGEQQSNNQKENRRAPIGSFSFSTSRDANEKPIRRMPRRGSLQYRIKSVMPVRRISVPKENDKDPGPMILKQRSSKKSLDRNKDPSLKNSINKASEIVTRSDSNDSSGAKKNNNDDGGLPQQQHQSEQQQGSFSFSTSRDANEKPIRRMPRRGSLQYRIKSVLPVRRISVPKENDKDPGLPVEPVEKKARPSLAKSSSKSSAKSLLSGSFTNQNRGNSPHRRFFQAMRRMGSKDKQHMNNNNNGGGYSSSSSDDEDDAAFVSSEEYEVEIFSKPKAQQEEEAAVPSSFPLPTKVDVTSKNQQQQQQQHEIPRRTKAYGSSDQGTITCGQADRISSTWEKSLVL